MSDCYDSEVWVDSPTFDFMRVSNFGRFWIKASEIIMPKGGIKVIKTKPRLGTLCKTNNGRYSRYMFSDTHRKIYNKKVHHLVAEAFLGPRPSKSSVVMHLDDNPLNNRVDNLKWGTQKENLNSPAFIEYCKSRTGESSPVRKGMAKRLF